MGKRRSSEQDFHFDYRFFLRLSKIARLVYPSFEWAAFYTIATLLSAIASEVVAYFIGQVPGDMYTALGNFDEQKFKYIFLVGSFEYLGKCLLNAFVSFFSWMLYLSWRSNAVRQLSNRYFYKRAYYNINCIDDHGIDNPDQRITQDVERMCNKLAINVLPSILIGPFVVAWYTYKTAQTAGGLGIAIIYGYFVLGTVVNKILLSPMVKWNARVEKAEGDFRFKHVTIRNNAESSALYNAELFEHHESDRLFNILWWRQFWFMCWKLPNLFWQQFFDYYGGILSYAIQYIPIFIYHRYDGTSSADLSGIISKNAFVYIYLVNSFTRMTDVALVVGEIAGIMQRITEFMRVCEESDEQQLRGKPTKGDSISDERLCVHLLGKQLHAYDGCSACCWRNSRHYAAVSGTTTISARRRHDDDSLYSITEFMRVCEESDEQQLRGKPTKGDSISDGGHDNLGADADVSTAVSDRENTLNDVKVESNSSSEDEEADNDIDVIYRIEALSYSQPDDDSRKMLEDLTMQVRSTSNIVITGPSGCGKSSLIRVIAGLWRQDSGTISCGKLSGYVMHAPQTPYFPSGNLTLRQQIVFPQVLQQYHYSVDTEDQRIEDILNALELGHLIGRCNGLDTSVDFDWQETLTPGEQQRLAFARILYQRPVMAILDESTSSVGVDMEERMYRLLEKNGIHYLSVGHRPTLIHYHDFELHLTGELTYEIRPIRKAASAGKP
ncbi:ATP-binding cassette sub-family D member 4 [Toxocara canis]|uniref:ATP-binding cassette sub-family D member 4 n=1 Tax=Toxocara canis TaxID=6265 RepID=A0A0B2VLZ4_TOXCA|nr:ATP-binding cassette sub-family D member 4 [Toxocara canis]